MFLFESVKTWLLLGGIVSLICLICADFMSDSGPTWWSLLYVVGVVVLVVAELIWGVICFSRLVSPFPSPRYRHPPVKREKK